MRAAERVQAIGRIFSNRLDIFVRQRDVLVLRTRLRELPGRDGMYDVRRCFESGEQSGKLDVAKRRTKSGSVQ